MSLRVFSNPLLTLRFSRLLDSPGADIRAYIKRLSRYSLFTFEDPQRLKASIDGTHTTIERSEAPDTGWVKYTLTSTDPQDPPSIVFVKGKPQLYPTIFVGAPDSDLPQTKVHLQGSQCQSDAQLIIHNFENARAHPDRPSPNATNWH